MWLWFRCRRPSCSVQGRSRDRWSPRRRRRRSPTPGPPGTAGRGALGCGQVVGGHLPYRLRRQEPVSVDGPLVEDHASEAAPVACGPLLRRALLPIYVRLPRWPARTLLPPISAAMRAEPSPGLVTQRKRDMRGKRAMACLPNTRTPSPRNEYPTRDIQGLRGRRSGVALPAWSQVVGRIGPSAVTAVRLVHSPIGPGVAPRGFPAVLARIWHGKSGCA
jgi:hypothetical protein